MADKVMDHFKGVKFVFWACPDCSGSNVKWNKDCTVATCRRCGRQSINIETYLLKEGNEKIDS